MQADRATKLLLSFVGTGLWAVAAGWLLSRGISAAPERFDTLTVQRINVVDPDGRIRLVLANSTLFPDVKYRGKTYPNSQRSVHDTAGLVFFDSKGEETGGLLLARLRDESLGNVTFDFTHQPTDGIYIMKRESADGMRWSAGFGISDRRDYEPGDIHSTQGVRRIWLANENQNAELVISDPQGRPRIRIGVGPSGDPRFEMLDQHGKAMYQAASERR